MKMNYIFIDKLFDLVETTHDFNSLFPEAIHLIPVRDAYPQLFPSRLKQTLIWTNPDLAQG